VGIGSNKDIYNLYHGETYFKIFFFLCSCGWEIRERSERGKERAEEADKREQQKQIRERERERDAVESIAVKEQIRRSLLWSTGQGDRRKGPLLPDNLLP